MKTKDLRAGGPEGSVRTAIPSRSKEGRREEEPGILQVCELVNSGFAEVRHIPTPPSNNEINSLGVDLWVRQKQRNELTVKILKTRGLGALGADGAAGVRFRDGNSDVMGAVEVRMGAVVTGHTNAVTRTVVRAGGKRLFGDIPEVSITKAFGSA